MELLDRGRETGAEVVEDPHCSGVYRQVGCAPLWTVVLWTDVTPRTGRMSVAKRGVRTDHVLMRIRLRTSLIAASVAAAALAVGAPSASAGLLVKSAPDCSAKPTSAAFSKVDGDRTQYWLAPGGDFEAGSTPWSLGGRASIVSGNEPWKLAGSDDSRSLKLPPGASATSPVVCVGIEHPAVRLVAKSTGLL